MSAITASHNGAPPKHREHQERELRRQRERDVLPDHTHRAFGVADEERDVLVVIAGQHDIDAFADGCPRSLGEGWVRHCTPTPASRTACIVGDFAVATRSSGAPPLNSTPRRAADVSAATTVTGVEITSAHGQASTRKIKPR